MAVCCVHACLSETEAAHAAGPSHVEPAPLQLHSASKAPADLPAVPCSLFPPFSQVARAADRALDAISDLSAEWEASVRRLKFEQHNRDWLNLAGLEAGLGQEQGKGAYEGAEPGEGAQGLCLQCGEAEGAARMVAGRDVYDAAGFAADAVVTAAAAAAAAAGECCAGVR